MPYRVRKRGSNYHVQVQKGGRWKTLKRYASKSGAMKYFRALKRSDHK